MKGYVYVYLNMYERKKDRVREIEKKRERMNRNFIKYKVLNEKNLLIIIARVEQNIKKSRNMRNENLFIRILYLR